MTEHSAAESVPQPTVAATTDIAAAPPPRRSPWRWLLFIAVVALGSVGVWRLGLLRGSKPPAVPVAPLPPAVGGDGFVVLSPGRQESLGLTVVAAVRQTDPAGLQLLGTTKYDEDVLSRVRMMFAGRVDKVYVRTGQSVKRGDPLVDLYSTVLADAKSDYEIRLVEWEYQSQLAKTRGDLRDKGGIAEQLYLETRSEEIRRRRLLEVARDKLLIYGLTDAEVESSHNETGAQKARMTLRSPADGIVVERNVVSGNLYDETDTLLIVTPVDHLWVVGNVFESDLDLVHVGQTWKIEFPFQHSTVTGTLQYVSNRVDPLTHAVHVRTSIPNPNGKLKSDMLVEGALQIEPQPHRLQIPRAALIVVGDVSYVFVRSADDPNKFARRRVTVVYESARRVLIDSGLSPGDQVVTTGALMVAQLFEDAQIEMPASAASGTSAAQ